MSARIDAPRSIPHPAAIGRNQPVAAWIWAGIGLCFLVMIAYIFGSWIMSPDFHPVSTGPDPVPDNIKVAVRVNEFLLTSLGLFTLWKFVFGPLLRDRNIPADGLLVIAFTSLMWTDPMVNYANHTLYYNAYAFNMGCWTNFIPGWSYPNEQNIGWPLLWMTPVYIALFIYTSMAGCWLLRRFRDRYPQSSMLWGIGILFVLLALVDAVMEKFFMMGIGVSVYSNVINSLTWDAGDVKQWPLYEGPIMSFALSGFTLFRYYRDDQGRTFVEKGVERMQLSSGKKKLLGFLAICGFVQVWFTFGYYLPYNLFALHVDTNPAYPSYFNSQICGEGTRNACPSRNWVPIPTRYGNIMVAPDDPRLPADVRAAQGLMGKEDPYAKCKTFSACNQ